MSENVTFSIKKESSFRRVSENTSIDELHSADEIPTTKQLKTASRNIHYYIYARANERRPVPTDATPERRPRPRLRTRGPETAHSQGRDCALVFRIICIQGKRSWCNMPHQKKHKGEKNKSHILNGPDSLLLIYTI